MALLKIARLGHPVLRQRAEPVTPAELNDPAFQTFVDDMVDTMRESDGVGLAAPQVYVSKRLFVAEVKAVNPRYPERPALPLIVAVNPEIEPIGADEAEDWEGCLSVPDLRGRVPRWQGVRVRALDRTGAPLAFEAQGFFARIVQHEADHLDGVFFLDRMRDLATLTHLREFERYWVKRE